MNNYLDLDYHDYDDHDYDVHDIIIMTMTRSLGALRALTSSRRPFGPLDFVLRALGALRPCEPRKGDQHQHLLVHLHVYDACICTAVMHVSVMHVSIMHDACIHDVCIQDACIHDACIHDACIHVAYIYDP